MTQKVTSTEAETVNKSPESDIFTIKFHKTFREELTPTLLKISSPVPKKCRGRNTLKLILIGTHHLDIKTRERHHKKKITRQ